MPSVKENYDAISRFLQPKNRATPVILQSELADCGLACMAMVASHFGYITDISTLKRKFPISSLGMSLRALIDIARNMEMTTRPVRIELDQLDKLSLPCVLHWKMNHFVVLTSVHKKHITINDPASGMKNVRYSEVNNYFTGVALEVFPSASFVKANEREPLKIQDLWSRAIGIKRSIIALICLSLVIHAFSLLSPLYMQIVIDDVLVSGRGSLLTALAIGFSIFLLIEVFTSSLRSFLVLRLSSWLGLQMSSNIFQHLVRLPSDYFMRRHMGDIVSRFSSVGAIRNFLTNGVVLVVVDGILAISTLLVMLIYSLKLTALALAAVLVYATIRLSTFVSYKTCTEEAIVSQAEESSIFMENLRAIQTIKVFQREDDRHLRWLGKLARATNGNIILEKWRVWYFVIATITFGAEGIICIYLGANMVMDSVFTVGMLLAYIQFKIRFTQSVNGVVDRLADFGMLRVHLDRLTDIAHHDKDCLHQSLIPVDLARPESKMDFRMISINNLSYKYNTSDPPIFENINFTVEEGSCVAIVGSSGCGKTTFLKIMMGLLSPTSGDIFLGDKSIFQCPEYRGSIASVLQDDQLFAGDLIENISCFDEAPDLELVYRSAQIACIHDDILKMPMKYNSLVGDMGSSLSGGQKQRVVLARALYRRPKVLFMDEATSHLDVATEKRVNENIAQLSITRVMVAHRVETIRYASKVYDLEQRMELATNHKDRI